MKTVSPNHPRTHTPFAPWRRVLKHGSMMWCFFLMALSSSVCVGSGPVVCRCHRPDKMFFFLCVCVRVPTQSYGVLKIQLNLAGYLKRRESDFVAGVKQVDQIYISDRLIWSLNGFFHSRHLTSFSRKCTYENSDKLSPDSLKKKRYILRLYKLFKTLPLTNCYLFGTAC